MSKNTQQVEWSDIEYSEELGVSKEALTIVTIFTNNFTFPVLISQIVATGNADAEFQVFFNSTLKAKFRTAEGGDRTMDLSLSVPFKLKVGGTIEVRVTHWDSFQADFNASIFYHKE